MSDSHIKSDRPRPQGNIAMMHECQEEMATYFRNCYVFGSGRIVDTKNYIFKAPIKRFISNFTKRKSKWHCQRTAKYVSNHSGIFQTTRLVCRVVTWACRVQFLQHFDIQQEIQVLEICYLISLWISQFAAVSNRDLPTKSLVLNANS